MKKILFVCMAIATLCFCSCTSENEVNNETLSENTNISNVSLLSTKMQAMNGGLSYRDATDEGTRLPNPNFTRSDKMKIAIADAKGAIKGGTSFWRSAGNAAVASAIKATKIYAEKMLRGYFQDQRHLHIPRNTNGGEIEDSIGYYHNVIEYEMYQQVSNLYTMSSLALCMKADSIIQIIIPEHERRPVNISRLISMAEDIDIIRNIDQDEEMSFVEYVDALMETYPEEADYIDMIAQYIYDINYANEDIDEYTNEILWLIETSDLSEDEIQILKNAVLVAYSSTLYNTNMIFIQN